MTKSMTNDKERKRSAFGFKSSLVIRHFESATSVQEFWNAAVAALLYICHVDRSVPPLRDHYSPNIWSPISTQRGFSRLINSAFLRARPFLELSLLGDGVAHIPILLVVNQFCAAVCGRKGGTHSFAVLPGSARQGIGHADLKNRMVTVRDDIDPETVIACHNRNSKRFLHPFDFAQGKTFGRNDRCRF